MAQVMEVWIRTGKIGDYQKKLNIRKASTKAYDLTTTPGSYMNAKSGTRSVISVVF